MRRRGYIPDRGDFVWLNLCPQRGHEQAGYRPALVLSPKLYNGTTGLCIICPGSRKIKGYQFEVPIQFGGKSEGVILADQVRCVDWRLRRIRLIRRVPPDLLDEVVAKLDVLIHPDEDE